MTSLPSQSDNAIPAVSPAMPDMSIFDGFNIIHETYVQRSANSYPPTPIAAKILLPKTLPPGKHPILINWHGGGLYSASALFPPFFPTFLLPFALKHNVIIISPDYTLLPSPNGLADICADITAFWSWLQQDFASVLAAQAPAHEADLAKIVVVGGSAGGYLATVFALNYVEHVQGLCLGYPMLDFDSDWWKLGSRAIGAPSSMYLPESNLPSDEELAKKLEAFKAGPVVSEGGPERMGLGSTLFRAGFFHRFANPDDRLVDDPMVWPMRRVQKGEKLPQRVWVFHGDSDTVVPVQGSRVFVEVLKEHKGTEVRYDEVEGMEHGFDGTVVEGRWAGVEDPVLVKGMKWLVEGWRGM